MESVNPHCYCNCICMLVSQLPYFTVALQLAHLPHWSNNMSTHRLLWKLLCLEGLSRNFWDKQESSWILILLLFVVIVGSYQSAAGLISPGEEMWFHAANDHTCPVFFTISWIWNFIRFCWWGLPCTCKLPVSCIGGAGYCIFYVNTVNRSYCFSGESKKFCFCSVCVGVFGWRQIIMSPEGGYTTFSF